jgi:beta-1,4-mannosyltransferase
MMEYLPLVAGLEGAQLRALLAGQYERRVGGALEGAGGSDLSLLGSVGGFVDGHLFVAPYLATHGYFGRERQKTRDLRRRLRVGQPEHVRVGVFVDELDEIHGVATMYRNLQARAGVTGGDSLQIVHCGGEEEAGAVRLHPIATMPLPLYAGRTLSVPSVLDVLDHVSREGYDVLHVATPGPLGIAALVAGVTLGLPIVGVYHTEFGAYARALSGDALVAELVEVLVRQFYERCAVVAVPSAATAAGLAARGYRIGRFEVLRNGVDTALYHPERRSEARWLALGGGRTLLLYAGRVSWEKGLEGLAAGYLELRSRRADVHLVVVGDGPYRAEMEALLEDTATFTGFLRGEELAATYAAADVFVFPSTTDTLGRAVAEAQASGVPAVVYGTGGPRECLRPGESGYVVEVGNAAGFWGRVEDLLDDAKLRRRMGRAARAFALTLSWDEVLAGLVALYRDVAGVPRPEPDSEPPAAALADRLTALVGRPVPSSVPVRSAGAPVDRGAMKAAVEEEPVVRVMAAPAFRARNRARNPYNMLLYGAMRRLGVAVADVSPGGLLRPAGVVHLHWPEYLFSARNRVLAFLRAIGLILALSWLRRRGRPIVWTVHNLGAHDVWHPRHEARMWRWFVRRVDGYIALSRGGQAALLERFPDLRDRPGFVIPHGLYRGVYPDRVSRHGARTALALPPEARIVAFLGAIRPYKNVPALISAFRGVEAPDWRLLVAGEPATSELAGAIRALAASDPRVRLDLAFVPDERVQLVLRADDLVVLPYREVLNSGSALLALSFERPLLLPERGALAELRSAIGPEWVRTYDGALEAATLVEGMNWVESTPRDPAVLQARFDWEEIARQTVAAYEAIRRQTAARGGRA